MPRGLIAGALIAAFSVAACGSSSSPQGPTASSVAVQPGDVPGGMVKCDLTGDIDSLLSKEKTADPSTYQSVKSEWDDARSKGAVAASVAFFTDSAAHCTGIKASTTDLGSATYKLVVNFVIQFKDESAASNGYTSGHIFNFSAADLKGGGQPVIEGTKTGLTANSVTLTEAFGGQAFYIAYWQNKVFMVILLVLNVDATGSKKIAVSENSRIK